MRLHSHLRLGVELEINVISTLFRRTVGAGVAAAFLFLHRRALASAAAAE